MARTRSAQSTKTRAHKPNPTPQKQQRVQGPDALSDSQSELSDLSDLGQEIQVDSEPEIEYEYGSDVEMQGDDSDEFEEAETNSSDSEYGAARKKAKGKSKKRLAAIKAPRRGYHCFDKISHELLSMVFNELDPHGINNLSATCSQLYDFAKSASVRADYLFYHYPRNEGLWRLLGRSGLCDVETIDAVIARGPKLSRYFIQVVCQAKVKQAPTWLGRRWARNLPMPAFAHLMSLASELFGPHICCFKGKTDDCILEGWVATGGRNDAPKKAVKVPPSWRRNRRALPHPIGPAEDDEAGQELVSVTFKTIKELFTDFHFSVFCPDDPVLARFGPAFVLRPEILAVAKTAGFRIDSSFKENVLNRALFDTQAVPMADHLKRIQDLVKADITFEADHIDTLLRGTELYGEESLLGTSQHFLTDTALHILKMLDQAGSLGAPLIERAIAVVRGFDTTESYAKAAILDRLASLLPDIMLDSAVQIKTILASTFLSLPNDKVTELQTILLGARTHYGSSTRIFKADTANRAAGFNRQVLQQRLDGMKLTASVDVFIELCQHSLVDSSPIVKMLLQDCHMDEDQKRRLVCVLIDTPLKGKALTDLATADRSFEDLILAVVQHRALDFARQHGKTSLGISLESAESLSLLSKYSRFGIITATVAGRSLIPARDHFDGIIDAGNGLALLNMFDASFEVLQIIFQHALLCGNATLVEECLQKGASITFEHFEWLKECGVAPTQSVFLALAEMPFIFRGCDATRQPVSEISCKNSCPYQDENSIHCCDIATAKASRKWYTELTQIVPPKHSNQYWSTPPFAKAVHLWLDSVRQKLPSIDG